jgi:DNA-binding transcriptional MerR regulator
VTELYSIRDVAKLFALQESRLRYWMQTGFVGPTVRKGGRFYYTFRDLCAVKAAKDLLAAGLSAHKVRKNLEALRRALPGDAHPALRLRLCSDGETIVALEDDVAYVPASGQVVMAFNLPALGGQVAELANAPAPAVDDAVPAAIADEATEATLGPTAYTCFVEACAAEDRGELTEAEALYRRALDVDPGLAAAMTNLGNLRHRAGDVAEARGAVRARAGPRSQPARGPLQPGQPPRRRRRDRAGDRRAAPGLSGRARVRRRPLQPRARPGPGRRRGPGPGPPRALPRARSRQRVGGPGPRVLDPARRMTTWPWRRRRRRVAAARDARGVLDGPLADDVPMSLARFGVPRAELIADLDVRAIPRGRRSGVVRRLAHRLAALDRRDRSRRADRRSTPPITLHLVIAQPTAPPDLGYLQAAWAVARWMVARGATVVLDVHAHTLLRGDRGAGGRPRPSIRDREVRVVFETDSARTERAHALHTRGLRKFGAPELVALCGQDDAAAGRLVISAARRRGRRRPPSWRARATASTCRRPRPGGSSTIATASPSCCSSTTPRGRRGRSPLGRARAPRRPVVACRLSP